MDKQTFHVVGMKCGVCAYAIQKQILRLKGVKHVFMHYDKQEVKVDYDRKKNSEEKMIRSVAPFGYTLRKTQDV